MIMTRIRGDAEGTVLASVQHTRERPNSQKTTEKPPNKEGLVLPPTRALPRVKGKFHGEHL